MDSLTLFLYILAFLLLARVAFAIIKNLLPTRPIEKNDIARPSLIIPELRSRHVKCIFKDDDETVFESKHHRICGRPDFLYHNKKTDDIILVEYKSKPGPIKSSDVNQTIATAIAVKESYPQLARAYILRAGGEIKCLTTTSPSSVLFKKIKREVEQVRSITRGYPPQIEPTFKKCIACNYQGKCPESKI